MNTLHLNTNPYFEPVPASQIRRPKTPMNWIWEGYIAAGSVTLLTSLWKSGKTTLISVLFTRMATGGTLAGRAVRTGKAVIVSEESESLWFDRCEQLNLGDHVGLFCQPFRGPSTPEKWEALIENLIARRQSEGLDLLVIDPLAAILPRMSESQSSLMLNALAPLQRLTALGVAVLVLHHPRKAKSVEGRAARGTGALSGAVDIIIEMSYFSHAASDDRRRKLAAFSRHSATPPRLAIELTADRSDYVSLGDYGEGEADQWRLIVEALLSDNPDGLTRKELLETWPSDVKLPSEATLWRWLDRAVAQAYLSRSGNGRRSNPYRYWLREDQASSA